MSAYHTKQPFTDFSEGHTQINISGQSDTPLLAGKARVLL